MSNNNCLIRSITNRGLNVFDDILNANNGLVVKNNQGNTLLDMGPGAGTSQTTLSLDNIDASSLGGTLDIGTSKALIINIGSGSNTINVKGVANINTTTTQNTNIGNTTSNISLTGNNISFTGTTNINTTGTDATSIGNTNNTLTLTGSSINFNSTLKITPTTNQLVLGTTNTTTINAEDAGGAKTYTIPNVGTTADFILSAGTQTISGAKTLSAITAISNATQSTSTSTGALIVTGGAGIGGNVYIGGNLIQSGAEIIPNETKNSGDTVLSAGGISFIDNLDTIFTTTLTDVGVSNGQEKTIQLLHQRGQPIKVIVSPKGSLYLDSSYWKRKLMFLNSEWRIIEHETPKFFVSTQQGLKLTGTGGVGGNQGSSVAISSDGDTLAFGSNTDDTNAGAVWVFTRTGTTWSQQGSKLVGTGATGSAEQGASISLSADGNTLAFGGNKDNSSVGAVWVFTRTAGVWSQQGSKLVGTGAVGASEQGVSISLSANGNTLVVGGDKDNSSAGAVWVFTRSGAVWSQQGSKLVGTGAIGSSLQGISVTLSVDGNTLVFGGSGDDTNTGAIWAFTRNGSTWTQQGDKITSVSSGIGLLGRNVALSSNGDTMITQNDTGIDTYTRSGQVWVQGEEIVTEIATNNKITLSSDGTFMCGRLTSGGAYTTAVFTRSKGKRWVRQTDLSVSDAGSGALSSFAISGEGNTMVSGDNSDGVWVFV